MIEINSPIALQTFQLNNFFFELFVPNQQAIKQTYLQQKLLHDDTPFPYWAKVWAAAVGLGYFINEQPGFVQDKTVIELAAGLGLPSLVAAKWAKTVCCSDYLQAPLNVVKASADHYNIKNINYKIIDWFNMPKDITTDVLLLSDINYEPTCFATLLSIVQQFLAKGTTIILSTPQRLLAKPFIEKLLPFCSLQQTVKVKENGNATWVQILVLTAD